MGQIGQIDKKGLINQKGQVSQMGQKGQMGQGMVDVERLRARSMIRFDSAKI